MMALRVGGDEEVMSCTTLTWSTVRFGRTFNLFNVFD